ncbi:MAG TPA: putative molybdenum carrier protein [Gemmataceae bacterium]|nr:putative molybdenum carrier protein [Gemmataceae bacterium]
MFAKIISGGQTGVDRAALDVALECGLPRGGWCPRDRTAEDGTIPADYPLTETPSADHAQRTEWNVRDSDGTLVLSRGRPTGGTGLTIRLATFLHKACLVVQLDEHPETAVVSAWAAKHAVRVLNVAGPRASQCPAIYAQAAEFLRQVFSDSAPP